MDRGVQTHQSVADSVAGATRTGRTDNPTTPDRVDEGGRKRRPSFETAARSLHASHIPRSSPSSHSLSPGETRIHHMALLEDEILISIIARRGRAGVTQRCFTEHDASTQGDRAHSYGYKILIVHTEQTTAEKYSR
ncbi:hypothetical protein GN956_G5162 [Arapaima gigas]